MSSHNPLPKSQVWPLFAVLRRVHRETRGTKPAFRWLNCAARRSAVVLSRYSERLTESNVSYGYASHFVSLSISRKMKISQCQADVSLLEWPPHPSSVQNVFVVRRNLIHCLQTFFNFDLVSNRLPGVSSLKHKCWQPNIVPEKWIEFPFWS